MKKVKVNLGRYIFYHSIGHCQLVVSAPVPLLDTISWDYTPSWIADITQNKG